MNREIRHTSWIVAAALASLAGCAAPLAADPQITDATRMKLARALAAEGDMAGAAAVLRDPNERAAKAPKTEADAGAKRAMMLIDLGQVDQGLALARAAYAAGRPAEAGEIYRHVLARHPEDADALVGDGVVKAQQGDLAGAMQDFRLALVRRPNDPAARNNLALALALNGRAGEAVPILEDLSRGPDTSALVRGNLALAQSGGIAAAAPSVSAGAPPATVAVSSTPMPAGPTAPIAVTVSPPIVETPAIPAAAGTGLPIAEPPAAVPSPISVTVSPQAAETPAPAPVPMPVAVPVPAVAPAAAPPPAAATPVPPAPGLAAAASGPPRELAPLFAPPPDPAPIVIASATPAAPRPSAAAAAGTTPGAASKVVAMADLATAPPAAAAGEAAAGGAPPADDGVAVQLGALTTEEGAVAFWDRMTSRHAALLAGLEPRYTQAEVRGRLWWRVRTGAFPDKHAAQAFCRSLLQRGAACIQAF